jgi:hypothetical protein
MHDFPDEAVPVASTAATSPPDEDVMEIRAWAADAILGPVPSKNAETASVRRVFPLFERLLSYGPHTALAVCLFGFAWMAGSYFSSSVRTVVQRGSVENGEMGRTVQKMVEEIRALRANIEAMHAAQSLSAKYATGLGNLKTRLDAGRTETSVAIAEIAGKVEHLQRESAARLSEVSERFDRIEHQIAGPIAAASVADASASGAVVARKRAQGGRGDAFDPSQNPTAPGVPRPLGTLAAAESANNSAGENAYGQRTN